MFYWLNWLTLNHYKTKRMRKPILKITMELQDIHFRMQPFIKDVRIKSRKTDPSTLLVRTALTLPSYPCGHNFVKCPDSPFPRIHTKEAVADLIRTTLCNCK